MAIKKTPAKKVVANKNIDPGRPVSRPMAPVSNNTGWGKTLTKKELVDLVDRIYNKQKERDMSKLSETIAKALAKKQGKTHIETDGTLVTDIKVKKVKTAPPSGKKPPTRSAGRGR